ncbi:MAG TPA: type II secretion system F family protein [Nocardioides sp.]|uniref:type II secretion system F family protein n=1 Tax=Nocardioides sp. TaxID=35761 RepID=UPI002ED8722D
MLTTSVAPVCAAVCAGAAVALLLTTRPTPDRPARVPRPAARFGFLTVAATALGLAAGPQVAVVAGFAGGLLAGAGLLWRRRAERVAAVRTASTVVEVCEQLSAELASGQPPGPALDRAAEDWPALAPVAKAFRIGSDVPAALRRAATTPGAGDLRWVAAAWQVAQRTGQGLADAVDRVAMELRAAQATRRVVDGELASARATAKLVAALPVAALAMGSGVGGDPWAFLFGTPVGTACLAVGALLGWVGLWWIEGIARSVDRSP